MQTPTLRNVIYYLAKSIVIFLSLYFGYRAGEWIFVISSEDKGVLLAIVSGAWVSVIFYFLHIEVISYLFRVRFADNRRT